MTVEQGKSYLVEVKGEIFCKGVNAKKYRIKIGEHYGSEVAHFYNPRGSKRLVTHYLDQLMFMDSECPNNNGTIILKEL